MIYSMTGYAAQIVPFFQMSLLIEIKSVNHRFLELSVKTSEEFRYLENNLRALVNNSINRGKVEVKIYNKNNLEEQNSLKLNNNLLTEYLKTYQQIANNLNISTAPDIQQIMLFPNMLKDQPVLNQESETTILTQFNQALANFKDSQLAEGNKLELVILARLNSISEIINQAQKMLPKISESYKQKIRERLKEVIDDSTINEQRFQQEFAYFCQKVDVAEEIDRLNAHLNEFKKLLVKGGTIGKRLDFLTQEMHREANTFGSKSVSIETTQLAVELKVLIEQIREQIQNIM